MFVARNELKSEDSTQLHNLPTNVKFLLQTFSRLTHVDILLHSWSGTMLDSKCGSRLWVTSFASFLEADYIDDDIFLRSSILLSNRTDR